MIHLVEFDASQSAIVCSTPFGIYEGFTSLPDSSLPPLPLCSTPFGIYEGFTVVRDPAVGKIDVECSTPFGIYEGFTGS